MAKTKNESPIASAGTIIRAANGDILRYDSTGLVMVLADQVISDIARRLPAEGRKTGVQHIWIDPAVLGDVDAWDLRRDGEWYLFSANLAGAQGVRQFRRLVEADDVETDPCIIADGAGPLRGLFSLGGPRRATGYDAALAFPWHVLSPADELGAVGHSGAAQANEVSALQVLPETTRDAALADLLVSRQHAEHKALSLFVARTETDSSASIHDLQNGRAFDNLKTAIASLKTCAARLGRPATLHALGLDFTLEDVVSDSISYRNGVFDLIAKLKAEVAQQGLNCPPILSVFDCGTHQISDHPVLRAQWELSWQGPEHGFYYSAPGYMFQQDTYARPTRDALWQMAEMDTCALDVLHAGDVWACPTLLLAEREHDAKKIRVRCSAMDALVLDQKDPFGAGPGHGFSVRGASNRCALKSVEIASDDPNDLILTFDKAPKGDALKIFYAFGQTAARSGTDYPAACGSLRDTWSCASKTGTTLHRWALPAVLPVW